MLKSHNFLLIVCQSNIKGIAARNIKEGIMAEPLAEALFQYAIEDYPSKRVKPYIQEPTYVGVDNGVRLQKCVAHNSSVKVVKHKKIGENSEGKAKYKDEYIEYKRLWALIINIMQTEDIKGSGYPLKVIGRYINLGSSRSPMLLWFLVGVVLGCSNP